MDSEGAGLPVLAFDERSVPAEHVFEVYHHSTATLFDTVPLDRTTPFRAGARDFLVDDLVVSHVRAGPHVLRRTDTHLRDGETDWITVQIHHSGGFRGQAGRAADVDLHSGRVGIVDLAKPFDLWSQGGRATWVGLPRWRINRADRLDAVRTLDRSSVRGMVLGSAVTDLWRNLGRARAEDAEELAGNIAETVNTVLEPDLFRPTDRDLRRAMEDYLKANLLDFTIGVDRLRTVFHCSRSTVYRAFDQHHGVDSFVRNQRLLRCFEELAQPTLRPVMVGEIARRWGFDNPSHFSRLFKAKFGLPPSALASARYPHDVGGTDPLAISDQIDTFRSWTVLG